MSAYGPYTRAELEAAQSRYGLTFPPDLFDLLRWRDIPNGYDWTCEDPAIRRMLDWPFETLLFHAQETGWWPSGHDRPVSAERRATMLRAVLATAPRLIPLSGHRFLPETPRGAGNPVLSMYGLDTIYYGADLVQWLGNELRGSYVVGPVRRVPFWSDLIDADNFARTDVNRLA